LSPIDAGFNEKPLIINLINFFISEECSISLISKDIVKIVHERRDET